MNSYNAFASSYDQRKSRDKNILIFKKILNKKTYVIRMYFFYDAMLRKRCDLHTGADNLINGWGKLAQPKVLNSNKMGYHYRAPTSGLQVGIKIKILFNEFFLKNREIVFA